MMGEGKQGEKKPLYFHKILIKTAGDKLLMQSPPLIRGVEGISIP